MTTETHTPLLPARRSVRKRMAFLALLAAVVVMALGACSPEEDRATQLVNQSRSSAGVAPLQTHFTLYLKAQAWSSQLARDQYLHHSNLAADNGTSWLKLGENVGMGYSIEQVHNAFMGSPGHQANILDGSFNTVGIGVTRDGGGRYWVVQEFERDAGY